MWQKWMACGLALLMLAGCTGRAAQSSSGQAVSSGSGTAAPEMPAPETPAQEPPAEETPADIQAPQEESQDNALDTYYTFRAYEVRPDWSGDGQQLLIVQDGRLTRVGLDNRLVSETQYGDADIGNETVKPKLAVGEAYCLRYQGLEDYAAQGTDETELVRLDGEWTICNAALYTSEGELVREFPTLDAEGFSQADGWQVEYDISQPGILFLDGTHMVWDRGDLLLLYDIQADAAEVVEDFRTQRWQGYTVGNSGSYGINQVGVMDGVYYYTKSVEEAPVPNPLRELWALYPDGSTERVFPEWESRDAQYLLREGWIYCEIPWSEQGTDGQVQGGIEALRGKPGDAAPETLLRTNEIRMFLDENIAPEGCLFYQESSGEDGWWTGILYHIETGERISYTPERTAENGEEQSCGFYGAYALDESGDRFLFVYVIDTLEGNRWEPAFYVWNSATGQAAPIEQIAEGENVWKMHPSEPYACVEHWQETPQGDGLQQYRVIPLT